MNTTRRNLLASVSAIAMAAMLGAGNAHAQLWRFFRGGPRPGGYPPRGNQPPTRPTCPPHNFVLWGTDNRTGRYVVRCVKCGLFKIG